MWGNEIVEEIRKFREKYASKFDYDKKNLPRSERKGKEKY